MHTHTHTDIYLSCWVLSWPTRTTLVGNLSDRYTPSPLTDVFVLFMFWFVGCAGEGGGRLETQREPAPLHDAGPTLLQAFNGGAGIRERERESG